MSSSNILKMFFDTDRKEFINELNQCPIHKELFILPKRFEFDAVYFVAAILNFNLYVF